MFFQESVSEYYAETAEEVRDKEDSDRCATGGSLNVDNGQERNDEDTQ